MTDRDALLRAICESSADDAPRLVYADWCDENGQPERAEFVRVQVEIGRLRGLRAELHGPEGVERLRRLDASHPDRQRDATLCGMVADLMPRERELLEANDYWDCLPFPSYALLELKPSIGMSGRLFRRGFVDSITCDASSWLSHHASLAWHPAHCEHDMPATAQPLTTVGLTTDWPDGAIVHVKSGVGGKYGWYRIAGEVVRIREHVLGVSNWDAAVAARWPWLAVELPPEPDGWGEIERAELETVPEFAGVTRWQQLNGPNSGAVVHSVPENLSTRLYEPGDPAVWVPLGMCRVELRTFTFQRDGVRYRLRAGRCGHGLAFFTRAEPQAGAARRLSRPRLG